MDDTRHLLRHLLATLAFRTGLCLRDAPPGFPDFGAGAGVRTPTELVRHLTGLMHFARGLLVGTSPQGLPPLDWPAEVARLQAALQELDAAVAGAPAWQPEPDGPLAALQGPLADALTHTGQLALLRRLAGSPIHGGNYARAAIRIGQVNLLQPARS